MTSIWHYSSQVYFSLFPSGVLSHFLAGESRVSEPYLSPRERRSWIITKHSYQWIPEGARCGHEIQYTALLQPASTSISRCKYTPPKMSWSPKIDILLKSGKITKAAICGQDASLWATSEGFSVSPEEVKNLLTGFNDSSALKESGLQMGGEQFIFMSGTDQVLKGVKKESGVHVAKTVQAIVIGCYDDPTTPDECAKEVDTMADCLKGMNY